ncbi:MAG TPA: mannonate dehydratase [Thermoguttaceae bacterium]|nr:mannonate dehydratase [Thermoguttaceae bacterium]
MKLALMLPGKRDDKWQLARQMGVRYAITKLHPELTGMEGPYCRDTLAYFLEQFAQAGLTLYGLESDEFDMQRIKLGQPGRDEDLEKYLRMIRNCGELGVKMICYNFMPTGWTRTRVDIPERGGALTSGFDYAAARNEPRKTDREYSAEEMWENYRYFAQAVIPEARKAGVQMALHPDDPPVSPLHGVARIFISAQAVREALDLAPGTCHGVAFCQATFKAMGENIEELVMEFGREKKIFFVHFRDIQGTAEHFQETFHDNGPTDMAKMLRLYQDVGFDGPLRPDHTPTMAGENNDQPGYAMLGRLFAVGYIKGLMHALGTAVE